MGDRAVDVEIRHGDPPAQIGNFARGGGTDLVVMTNYGKAGWQRWFASNVTSEVIYQTTPPLMVVRPTEHWRSTRSRFSRLLVALDGSEIAEQVLPYVHELARRFESRVILLSVQEGGDSEAYVQKLRDYLDRLKMQLEREGVSARTVVADSAPAQAILRTADSENADLIMMVTHGRGGVARQQYVKLGSVVVRVLQEAPCAVFLVSAGSDQAAGVDSSPASRQRSIVA